MSQPGNVLIPWLIACLGAFAVAVAGGLATNIGAWYFQLIKPLWQPPDWVFGPAWTVIFALCAVAAAKSWMAAPHARARQLTVTLFCINGVLNIMWSVLFFSLRRPDWALLQVFFLWLSVAALIFFLGQFYGFARWLLLPYLLWVMFAATLNASIVQLNAPFG
jgi:tryptophan-rich sensory protein